ncbi:MAG: ClbS/DfsB family four-helix bundle protein, partial [Chloroflexota bacterium]|nr:ClbS/DfsB family four-helix bundle protein [Chloroflexota bacterium]
GKSPEIPAPGVTWDDMDQLNERTFARDRDRSLQEVLENSQRSFQQLLAQVQAFSEEELTDPQRFAWMSGAPLWQRIIAGPGYGHYQAHLYDLLQLTDRRYWFKPDPTLLTKYVGIYTDADGDSVKTQLEGDQLVFTLPKSEGEQEVTSMAVDTTRFAYENGGLVEFLIANNGEPEAIRWWGFVYPRVE